VAQVEGLKPSDLCSKCHRAWDDHQWFDGVVALVRPICPVLEKRSK